MAVGFRICTQRGAGQELPSRTIRSSSEVGLWEFTSYEQAKGLVLFTLGKPVPTFLIQPFSQTKDYNLNLAFLLFFLQTHGAMGLMFTFQALGLSDSYQVVESLIQRGVWSKDPVCI